MLGAAFLAEEAADECVTSPSTEQSKRLKARYQEWLATYASALEDLQKIAKKENKKEMLIPIDTS